MLIAVAMLGAGLALLYGGGSWVVRGASSVALRAGMSPFMVGLTVVAFATSGPELVVSVTSALEGVDDVALGNVVGSNIANIGLVLALSVLVRPVRVEAKVLRGDMPWLFLVTLLVVWWLMNGRLQRLEGLALFAGLILFVFQNLRLSRRESQRVLAEFNKAVSESVPASLNAWLLVLAGMAALGGGGTVFVEGAIRISELAGVSTGLVGLTIVAVGTSLPELATSIVASMKDEGDMAAGNVIGSNFFNLLCVLGLTSLIHPLQLGDVQMIDLLAMVGMTAILIPIMYSGFRISRWEGLVLLLFYGGYLVFLAQRLPSG